MVTTLTYTVVLAIKQVISLVYQNTRICLGTANNGRVDNYEQRFGGIGRLTHQKAWRVCAVAHKSASLVIWRRSVVVEALARVARGRLHHD